MIFPTIANYQRTVGVSTWFSWLDWGQPSTFFQSPLIFAMSLFGDVIVAYKFFVIISFFLSGLTAYFVASRFVGFPLSALVAGVIYMNSQFLFSQFFEGHLDIMFGYALFPLAIYFAYSLFTATFAQSVLYIAFEVLFLFSAHLNIAYIGGLSIVATLILSAIVHRHLGVKSLLKKAALLLITGLSLSAFFLIPFLGGARPIYITYSSIATEPTETIPLWLYESITGVSSENSFIYFWKHTSYSYPFALEYSGVSIGGLLLFLGACISVVRHRRRFSVWLFATLVISTLLATGMTTPFGSVFALFWKFMPFFNTVRFLDRWLMLQALSQSLLIAILFKGHLTKDSFPKSRFKRLHQPKSVKVVFIVIIIVGIASPTAYVLAPPSWELPAEYDQAANWLSANAGDSSTMIVPFGGVYIRSGEFGVSRSPGYFEPLLSGNPAYTGEGGTSETRKLSVLIGNSIVNDRSSKIPKILGWMGTRYFLFCPPTNDSLFSKGWNQISSVWNPNLNYELFSNQSGMSKMETFGNLEIYSNSNSEGEFVISDSPIVLVGGQNSLLMAAEVSGDLSATPAFVALSQLPQSYASSLTDSSVLMFADANYDDLLMLNVNADCLFTGQELLQFVDGNPVFDTYAIDEGYLVLSESTLKLSSGSSMAIGGVFSTDKRASIWLRLGFGPDGANLKISTGNSSKLITTKADLFQGFRWIEAFADVLPDKQISIEILGAKEDFSYFDALAIVPSKDMRTARAETEAEIEQAENRIFYFTGGNPSINSSGFRLVEESHDSEYGYSLVSSGPSELSIPIGTTSGEYYIYVRHGVEPYNGASFSVKVNNQTVDSPGTFSNASADVRLQGSEWIASATLDEVAFYQGENLETVILWQLSDRTDEVSRYLHHQSQPLDLSNCNFAELSVFGDKSGNSIGAYFYNSANQWVHFSFTDREGINWEGWREIVFGLDTYDSSSDGFDWSKITGITLEYARMPNCSASSIIKFTPYAFYRFEDKNSNFTWSMLGPFKLSNGLTDIHLSTNGSLSMDCFLVTDVDTIGGVSRLFGSSYSLSNLTKTSETEFFVPVQGNGCSIVIFKQSYHPLWRASLGTQELQHVTVNFALNGFVIDEDAKGTLRIWFEGDRLLSMGVWTSAISLSVIVIVILAANIRKRRLYSEVIAAV